MLHYNACYENEIYFKIVNVVGFISRKCNESVVDRSIKMQNFVPSQGIEPWSPAWQAGILATIPWRIFWFFENQTYSSTVYTYNHTSILQPYIHTHTTQYSYQTQTNKHTNL